jgi:hypothetical protein
VLERREAALEHAAKTAGTLLLVLAISILADRPVTLLLGLLLASTVLRRSAIVDE